VGEIVEFKRLTADEILAIDDRKTEDVEVPEWNALVTIRSLTGHERDRLEAAMVTERGGTRSLNFNNLRAKLIAASAVDANGKLLFDQSQVEALGRKNAGALTRLFSAASRLSGYTESDVRELTIELGNGQSAELGSDLQDTSVLVPSDNSSKT
jgi:hypothetical protein